MLGLLLGTVLYIVGGYFLPFLVYSVIMLVCVPFVAKVIPAKPMEDTASVPKNPSASGDDIELGESKNSSEDKDLGMKSETV